MLTSNAQIELMREARAKATFRTSELLNIVYEEDVALPLSSLGVSRPPATSSDAVALENTPSQKIQDTAFVRTINQQASVEQQKYWQPLIATGEITGICLETELGHDTHLRGLETTATFDGETDQFIIHSPTISSTKYWVGRLPYPVSHALVTARLIIKGIHFGVHLFIVQLFKDKKPAKGVKLSYTKTQKDLKGTDYRYAILKNVRIPRTNMLMGTAQVTQNGIYTWVESTKEADNIALYSDVRAIHKITFLLARATTIATRYSIVRTQGHGFYNESTPEVPIFNLKSQHHRLLALTAQSYALLFASKTISKQLITQRSRADHSSLPYTQALLAGLKAYAAETAGDGAEAARRCCGALGCSAQLSAFAEISTELAHYSADAHNHYQQTAIYLMRTVVKIVAEKPIDVEMSYLAEAFRAQHQKLGTTTAPGEANNKNDPPTLLRHRTAHLILTAEAALHKANKEEINRLGRRSAWGALVLPLTAAARAHVELFVLESFVSHTFASSIPGDELRSVLENLCGLFAVNMLEMREGLGVGDALEKALLAEAVGLGDAWGFEDGVLGALGVESGDIYGAVMRKMREKEVKGVEGRMSKF